MAKSVLVAVFLGLAGPQCPGSSEQAPATPPPPDAAPGAEPAPEAAAPADDGGGERPLAVADAGLAPGGEPGEPTPTDRLRAAWDAFRAGRWAEAEAGFRGLLGMWPAVDDVLRFRALEAAYRAGRLDAARSDAEALVAAGGPHAKEAAVRLADIAYDQERWADATAAYKELLRGRLPRTIDETALRLRRGRCLEAQGDAAGARAVYEEIFRREPGHAAAAEAEARLRVIDPAFVVPATWRLERARRLVRAREWARAVDELDLIPAGTTRPPPEEAAWERAHALYLHRRRWDESARAFAVVVEMRGPHEEEAAFLRARSLDRDERDEEAIVAYREFARDYPRSPDAVDARHLAAALELYLGRTDAALAALEELVGRNRGGPGRPQSRWSLAMAYLLAGRPADALVLIDGTADDDEEDVLVHDRALYWGAVARIGLDRKAEAAALLRRIIADHPLHWYALLARNRLAEIGEEVPPPYPSRDVGRSDARERCDDLPAEVAALLGGGLRADARALLVEQLRPAMEEATGDELRDLAGRLLCVDAADVVYRHAASAHREDWCLTLGADNAAFWEAAYPKAYGERVEAACAREGISPYVIWSIMRQESSFDPDVVSTADAIGLLQMIPPTTRRMLAGRGEAYEDGMLFDPDRNIELGVEYIAWIGRKFHGQIPLLAAGYNGGPHNVARWLTDTAEERLDYFVERIPFDQTRNYVRRVITSYARYLFLYETEGNEWPLDLPATIRMDYLPDPDY